MSETEAEITPLDQLKALVAAIEARKKDIAAANDLPGQAKAHVEEMYANLTGTNTILWALGGAFGGWPDFIKRNASDGLARLKLDLIDKAGVERDRIVLMASLEINDLALKIDKLSRDVMKSLIVSVPPANEQ